MLYRITLWIVLVTLSRQNSSSKQSHGAIRCNTDPVELVSIKSSFTLASSTNGAEYSFTRSKALPILEVSNHENNLVIY